MNGEIDIPIPGKEARNWAMICHLSALAGLVTPLSGLIIPFVNVLGPLIVWAIKKDEHAFVNTQGKEAINFQLTMSIAYIICIPLIFVIIGIFLLWILSIYSLIMIIVASIKANDGIEFRYPFTIRFIK